MSPEHCLKLERWQGPPHINKVQQCEVMLFFKISCLFSLSVMITNDILHL